MTWFDQHAVGGAVKELIQALNGLTWPGAFALVAIVVCACVVAVVFLREFFA